MKSVVKRRVALMLASMCCSIGLLIGSAHSTRADRFMRPSLRLFMFPLSLVNGVSGDLVVPAGNSTALRFDVGKVAVGELPIPLADRSARPGRRGGSKFVRPLAAGPRARLLLRGVIDGSGNPATNSGNQLIIDAVVSPGGAASSTPPFVVPFDIDGGSAFVDVALPVMNQADGAVRVQILGVRVVDPDGQPFGTLGFELRAMGGTPNPSMPPTPDRTPASDEPPTPSPVPCGVGQCFDTITFQCTGHVCGADMRCPLPNQFCDVSGRRCPCASPPPPPPHGHICCQCDSGGGSRCMEIPFVEVQPLCPSGCDTFVGESCAADSGTCVGTAPCAADADCDDGNGCTVDHCRDGACKHDCVCVGPVGCGPGPGRGHPH